MNIDKQLREIAFELFRSGRKTYTPEEFKQVEEAIVQIKAAFKEEGWITSEEYIKAKLEWAQYARSGEFWLERFKQELGEGSNNCEGCSCDAIAAAERASNNER